MIKIKLLPELQKNLLFFILFFNKFCLLFRKSSILIENIRKKTTQNTPIKNIYQSHFILKGSKIYI